MSEEEVIETIQTWFVDNTGSSFGITQEYMTSGLIDSFNTIDLILYMESSFDIKFVAEDFQNPNFATIAGLSSLIGEKLNRG